MKRTLLATIALLIPTICDAQTLTEQINAVDAAQEDEQWREQKAQEAQARHIAEIQKAEAALQRKKEAEKLAAKKRDQDYEDQFRALNVKERELQIEAEKARVARSNDYIDQELKAKAAETDVVKSQADATRNVSEGTKSLLQDEGQADVRSQSGIFR